MKKVLLFVLAIALLSMSCVSCSNKKVVDGGALVRDDFNLYKSNGELNADPRVRKDNYAFSYSDESGNTARGIKVGDDIDAVISAYKGIVTYEIDIKKDMGNGQVILDTVEGLLPESLRDKEMTVRSILVSDQNYPVDYKKDISSIKFVDMEGYALYINFKEGKVSWIYVFTPEGHYHYLKKIQEGVESKLAQ